MASIAFLDSKRYDVLWSNILITLVLSKKRKKKGFVGILAVFKVLRGYFEHSQCFVDILGHFHYLVVF